jgi:hypothetical protein
MGQDNDRVVSGLISERDLDRIREAVGVHVEKIYDSCRDKDCIENARVYFDRLTDAEIRAINDAFNVKIRTAEVSDVITDIEAVPFKRGFYTVDVKFIIAVTLDFFTRVTMGAREKIHVTTVEGSISYDKKIILFGSEGGVKIFKSLFQPRALDVQSNSELQQSNLPFCKIEVAEPIPLSAKMKSLLDKDDDRETERGPGPQQGPILTKRVYVTVGLFSIVSLARIVPLLIPAFDFSYPYKHCPSATDDNPCDLFDTFDFPYDEFYPPQKFDFPGATEQEKLLLEDMHECKD